MTELNTNKAIAVGKHAKRPVRPHLQKALNSGDAQQVIDCLTDKQKSFVEEYLKDLNGSEAVRRSGYQTRNPNRIASELLRNPGVRFAIDALKLERAEASDVTSDYVLKRIHQIVESTHNSKPNIALRGLELLGKHLGILKERTEISGPDGDAIRYEQKVMEDAADFTRAIARLSDRGGEDEVVRLINGGAKS